jgi:ADP-ribose pyrophosphatase
MVETLGTYYSSPGLTPERYTVVRASELAQVGHGGGVDGEDIAVHRVRLADLPDFVRRKRAEGVGTDVKLWLVLGLNAV